MYLKLNTWILNTREEDIMDLEIDSGHVKGCNLFKYLEVIFLSNGKRRKEISNKIVQLKRATHQLKSILSNNRITQKAKHIT